MAVNLCNALADVGCDTHLCATRLSGPMAEFIDPQVHLHVLNKKQTLDLSAAIRLKRYIHQHDIQVVHAHSSSFFMGCLIKWLTGVCLIWHNHYGDSENLPKRSAALLRHFSRNFNWALSVNESLRKWAIKNLHMAAEQISYLQNFPSLNDSIPLQSTLPGKKENRIVCTARLHRQKDHLTLVKAMSIVHKHGPDSQLLLVGQDMHDEYSDSIKNLVLELNLNRHVHLLGGRTDIAAILKESSIGVLSSESEGLPVALLEYGLSGLAAVCTNVGECSAVLGNGQYGKVVLPKNPETLAAALIELLENADERSRLADAIQKHVRQNYSGEAVARQLTDIYQRICHVA